MQIDQLHTLNIYQGLLACSNVRGYNERFLANLETYTHNHLPSHIPLHTIIPDTAPDSLPRFISIILLNGTPVGRENECDENGEPYNGHWLGVVSFIEEPSAEYIAESIVQAKRVFDTHAKGYFF